MDEKIVEDDDQSSVGSSNDSSIFSILDSASSGSQSSTDGLLSAVDELVEMMANDEILKPLYRAAVSDQTIGGDVFEVKFRRLLESCSEELKMEAHQQLQGYAVKLLRSRAAYVCRLRALHDPRYDDKEKEMRKVHTQRNERLGPEIVEQVNSWSQALITPDFSNATTSRIICPICSKEFKGNLQDAKSNLRRHLRNSPRHTREYSLKCPMPECEKKSRMRSDNLGKHLQNIHKISSKSERQSIIGQCRQIPPDRATPGPEYELLQVAEEAEEGFRALQSIEQELEPNDDLLDLQSLVDLEEFFLWSDAFINLRTNFRQCMLPPETIVLSPDIHQQVHSAQNEDPPGICAETDHSASPRFFKALSLQVTKMQTLHTSIRYRLADLSSLLWGWGSRICESYMRRWEPLIDRDKVRIRWECRCGRKLWDDFRELRPRAAEDLRRSLHFNESTVSAQGTNEPSSYSLGGNGNLSVARTPVLSNSGASNHSHAATAATEGGVVTTEPPSSTSPGPEPKFLLLCFRKPGDTLRLYHLNVEDIKTDFELMRLLQQKYWTHQGLLGRFFSPRKIKSVMFRKVRHQT